MYETLFESSGVRLEQVVNTMLSAHSKNKNCNSYITCFNNVLFSILDIIYTVDYNVL